MRCQKATSVTEFVFYMIRNIDKGVNKKRQKRG